MTSVRDAKDEVGGSALADWSLRSSDLHYTLATLAIREGRSGLRLLIRLQAHHRSIESVTNAVRGSSC